jgi:hypothetical protein
LILPPALLGQRFRFNAKLTRHAHPGIRAGAIDTPVFAGRSAHATKNAIMCEFETKIAAFTWASL